MVVFILNTASPWIIPKRLTAPQHTRFILPLFHPTKSSLRCMGGIFLLRETHLENFMSRPNVIPTFRQRRCTNRGRNFVRSKRRSTYTSSGTLYLFLRLNNSETILSAVVEGKNRPVATNFQFLKFSCPSGTSLLKLLRVFQVILLGRACPKPCQIQAKGHYLPRCFSFRFCCFSSN